MVNISSESALTQSGDARPASACSCGQRKALETKNCLRQGNCHAGEGWWLTMATIPPEAADDDDVHTLIWEFHLFIRYWPPVLTRGQRFKYDALRLVVTLNNVTFVGPVARCRILVEAGNVCHLGAL